MRQLKLIALSVISVSGLCQNAFAEENWTGARAVSNVIVDTGFVEIEMAGNPVNGGDCGTPNKMYLRTDNPNFSQYEILVLSGFMLGTSVDINVATTSCDVVEIR